MTSNSSTPRPAYGWSDFDQEVVGGLVENDSRFINRRSNGWILSPLLGHYNTQLAWKDDNYKKGSVPIGDPPVSFRAAPTYVLEEPLDNIIAGRELIAGAVAGEWGKAETRRLGHENSEDALTWNVLRSLQEAGALHVATALAGIEGTVEPSLFFWGRHVEHDGSSAWTELQQAREHLEARRGQQTEPDACLRIEGWGWVFIEAKFGSPTTAYDNAALVESWLERYSAACPGLFDDEAIRKVKLREFPEQLLRNVAFAHKLKAPAEQAVVLALTRERDVTDVEKWVGRCLADTADVAFRRITWESLYAALDPDDAALVPLRAYLENKSYGLRRAFALGDESDAEET